MDRKSESLLKKAWEANSSAMAPALAATCVARNADFCIEKLSRHSSQGNKSQDILDSLSVMGKAVAVSPYYKYQELKFLEYKSFSMESIYSVQKNLNHPEGCLYYHPGSTCDFFFFFPGTPGFPEICRSLPRKELQFQGTSFWASGKSKNLHEDSS